MTLAIIEAIAQYFTVNASYPGLLQVTEKDGDLILNTTEKNLENARRTRKSAVRSVCDDHPIIVVGGGKVHALLFFSDST